MTGKGYKSRGHYDEALGLREVESEIAATFEAEFPHVVGRTVRLVSSGESPDRMALVDGVETGVELTAVKAGSAEDIVAELDRIASRKGASYARRGIFNGPPIILLGHLDWPAREVEGPALYDLWEELAALLGAEDFERFGFSEVWLMDYSAKYTSRRDPRAPADFFCFAPSAFAGFWQRERKRRPYWGLVRDFLT